MNVVIKKGMSRDKINTILKDNVRLLDDLYLGNRHNHRWLCKCGNIFERSWSNIKHRNSTDCGCVIYNEQEIKYKYNVEKSGDYEYIRSFRRGDKLPNGKTVKAPYLQIKHKYCGSIYEIKASQFINLEVRCSNCCGSYENSFAYHIEKELGEPLEKYWDFEKNTVNPHHIWKGGGKKVWIKCQKKDYHDSYETVCSHFKSGGRCIYCKPNAKSIKVHPKDSFAQYHIDNTDKDFLEKYWSDKNTVDPFTLAINSSTEILLKCQNKSYHDNYITMPLKFTRGDGCTYCYGSKHVHILDSFGTLYPEYVNYWHKDNKVTPYDVKPNSNKKFKLICKDCNNEFWITLNNLVNSRGCSKCNMSKGEKKIYKYLLKENIEFVYNEEYFKDLLSIKSNPLRPDFILPNHKIWIEYDGEFHYEKIYNGCGYETLKIHDKIKNEYAKKHGWEMIRIPYWEFKNIEEILFNRLKNECEVVK